MSENEKTIMVTVEDARACRFCFSGSRTWAARHGLSWIEFVNNGLPIEVFENLGDAFADAVAKQARKRVSR